MLCPYLSLPIRQGHHLTIAICCLYLFICCFKLLSNILEYVFNLITSLICKQLCFSGDNVGLFQMLQIADLLRTLVHLYCQFNLKARLYSCQLMNRLVLYYEFIIELFIFVSNVLKKKFLRIKFHIQYQIVSL